MAQGDIGTYASQISGHLWAPNGAYDALATVTVPAGGVASITFAGIPQGYKHLQIRTRHFTDGWLIMQFNNVTASGSYFGHELRGDGSGITAQYLAGYDSSFMWIGLTQGVATVAASIIDVLDYASPIKNKTVKSLAGNDANGSGYIQLTSNCRPSFDPVTSITLKNNYGSNFAQYSQFALYGVK